MCRHTSVLSTGTPAPDLLLSSYAKLDKLLPLFFFFSPLGLPLPLKTPLAKEPLANFWLQAVKPWLTCSPNVLLPSDNIICVFYGNHWPSFFFLLSPFLSFQKDFADTIPGHGGIMDRFDCQYLMATFVHVYITSFIRYGLFTILTTEACTGTVS